MVGAGALSRCRGVRYDELETERGPGLELAGGARLKLDRQERDVMRRRPDLDIITFRMLLALHMRWHFKHVWARRI